MLNWGGDENPEIKQEIENLKQANNRQDTEIQNQKNRLDAKSNVFNKMVFYSTGTFKNMKITFLPPKHNGWGLLIGRNAGSQAVLIIVSPSYKNSFTPAFSNSNITTSLNTEGGVEITLKNAGGWFEGIFIGDFKSISYF